MRAIACASILVLGLSACGGETFDEGAAGDAGSSGSGAAGGSGGSGGGGSGGTGAAGSGGAAASPNLEGSYDLSFDSVTPAPAFGATSPSVGSTARLDIRRSATGYDAVFCARWNDAAVYSVSVGSASVLLEGEGGFHETGIEDTWSQIVLGLGADGFSGTMTATGTNDVTMGDVISVSDVTATGRVSSDTLAPEFDQIVEVAPFLPWDAIRLEAAEPVDAAELIGSTSVGTRPVAWSTTPEPAIGSEWAGITKLTGYFTYWDPVVQERPPDNVLVAGGVHDRSGHASASFAGPAFVVSFVGTGQPLETILRWGSALLLGSASSDARCESGACISIEFENQYCVSGPSGIAVRLFGTTANVRYRLIVHDALSSDGKPSYVPLPFRLETAVPGAPSQTTYPPTVDASQLQPYTDPVQQLANRWATPWSTLSVPGGQSGTAAADFGLAIHAGGYSGCGGGGGPAPPPVTTTILVDRIDAS